MAQTDLDTFARYLNIEPVAVIYKPKIRNEVTDLKGRGVLEEEGISSNYMGYDGNVLPLCICSNLHLEASVVRPR